jgi:hypothetical protein
MALKDVHDNMKLAHNHDAIKDQKFVFRKAFDSAKATFVQLTVHQIINGNDQRTGLLRSKHTHSFVTMS